MYKIYWTDPATNNAFSKDYENLTEALTQCESARRQGSTFVTMVSENPGQVGKPGAVGVVDGVLPDGTKYEWSKNYRVGAAFKCPPPVSTDNLIVELDDPN